MAYSYCQNILQLRIVPTFHPLSSKIGVLDAIVHKFCSITILENWLDFYYTNETNARKYSLAFRQTLSNYDYHLEPRLNTQLFRL